MVTLKPRKFSALCMYLNVEGWVIPFFVSFFQVTLDTPSYFQAWRTLLLTIRYQVFWGRVIASRPVQLVVLNTAARLPAVVLYTAPVILGVASGLTIIPHATRTAFPVLLWMKDFTSPAVQVPILRGMRTVVARALFSVEERRMHPIFLHAWVLRRAL